MKDFLAATTWETVNLQAAWRSLEDSIQHLDTPQQMQLVGSAIEHLVELFVASSEQVFEELDATMRHEGPQMTIEQFLPYVRQGMEIDFSQFVGGFDPCGNCEAERNSARGPYAPRMPGGAEMDEERTIVATVDPAKLADAVEGLETAQNLDLEAALELAHIEDVEAWASAISAYFEAEEVETVSLQMLQRSIHTKLNSIQGR